MTSSEQRTIPRLFEDSVQQFLAESTDVGEERVGLQRCPRIAKSRVRSPMCLQAHQPGVEKGDRIGLISEGRNDWVIAELGILFVGAINVPLSVKLEERSDLEVPPRPFRMQDGGRFRGTSIQKLQEMRADLPTSKKIILLDPEGKLAEDEVGFPELFERGTE